MLAQQKLSHTLVGPAGWPAGLLGVQRRCDSVATGPGVFSGTQFQQVVRLPCCYTPAFPAPGSWRTVQ